MSMRAKNRNLLLFGLLACAVAFGQSDRGIIKGTVLDSQGMAVSAAKVTLSNTATGIVSETSTEITGNFTFPGLPVGVYQVTCEATGFKKSVQDAINVDVGRTVGLQIVLQPGEVLETVTVEASAPPLDTETSDIGTSVTRRQIIDLPMPLTSDSRNPLNFVILTPGVSGSVPGATPDLRLHVSGAPSSSSEVYIDGVPVAQAGQTGDISTNHPSLEAIGEFKISNNNYAAEYGLASGIISFTFRSGTNDLHGRLFEYFQNEHLNALDYPTKSRGQTKAPLKQNEYGFTLGGPVYIPKIYSGKDRTFFFTSFTGFRYRPSSNNPNLTTFPNSFREGDFSQLLGPQLTAPNPLNPAERLPIFDAAGRPVYTGAIYDPTQSRMVTGPDGNVYPIRDPFPNNRIPSNYPGLSKAGQEILKYFPKATTDAIYNNFFRTTRSQVNQERFVAKIDHHIGANQSLSGSVFIGSNVNENIGTLTMLEATRADAPSLQTRLNHTYTYSPRLINNLSLGFLRDKGFAGPAQPGPGLQALGIKGISLPPGAPFPSIQIRNQNAIGSESIALIAENRYVVNDSVTWIRGAHTFKFGGELRRLQRNEVPNNSGRFVFEPTQTALNGTGFVNTAAGPRAVTIPGSTGSAAASFLFGAPDFSRFSLGYTTAGYRWLVAGGYAQDDWKATRNLTLNLGFRYDLMIPRTEVLGRVSTVDIGLANPAAGGARGAYTFYGNGPGRNGRKRIGDIDFFCLQPRLGVAWSPEAAAGIPGKLLGAHRTVLRSGFAITRPMGNDNLTNAISGSLYAPGFNGVATANRPGDVLGSPAFFWDQPFPNFTPPPTLDPGLLVGNVNPSLIYSESGRPPTQVNWAFEIQRSLPSDMVASVGYVGTHVYHLGIWRKPNQVPVEAAQNYAGAAKAAGLPLNQFMALRITDPRVVASGLQAPFSNFVQLFGAAATVGQALRPYPQYGNIDNLMVPLGVIVVVVL
ncbi:MAG: TonB-dependent receptor, partial [Acidobacteria bacterium]|nr:TonB-dependent receptor [Acidobacteriota bacterium]